MKDNLLAIRPTSQAAPSILACAFLALTTLYVAADEVNLEVKIEVDGPEGKVVVNGKEIKVDQANGKIQIINGNLIVQGPDQPPIMRFFDIDPSNHRLANGADKDNAPSPRDELRPDRLEFFDGSVLRGELHALQGRRQLVWKHPAANTPFRFQYAAVASISLEGRAPPQNNHLGEEGLRCLLNFRNGDSCYGNLIGMDAENLDLLTAFAGRVKAPRKTVGALLALPDSFESLYDLSQGLSNWKLTNGKSWKLEQGKLVSIGSGTLGRKLQRKENIALEFDVQWDRSFYFNVRLFAENPESNSYNNEAYNLTFSSNRVNLTASKTKKGRVVRETIGSANLNAFHSSNRKARIFIFANRKTKTFAISVNGSRIARWKDPDEESPPPKGDALVLYNQGGSSQLRISKLAITGWEGDFEPPEATKSDPSETAVTFVNGDAAKGEIGDIRDGKLEVRSSAGNFAVPFERIRRISFAGDEISDFKIYSDHAWLAHGLGDLSLTIEGLADGNFTASSPIFGKVDIGQGWLRRIHCNRHLIELEQYLATLRLAERAIAIRNFPVARDALLRTRPHYRGWQWGRLFFHVLSQDSEELLQFRSYEDGIEGAVYSRDGKNVLTGGLAGGHHVWDVRPEEINEEGWKVVEEGKGLDVGYPRPEIGRYPNELLHQVHLSRDFWMSPFEITQAQYESIVGENPSSNAKAPNLPVENVSWNDAREFCLKLNQKHPPPQGYVYRLPTTAEWEYACRAGSQGPYAGTRRGELRQAADYLETLDEFGWFSNNSESVSHPVGEKKPNAFGLHDMHGNVWEWCLDHVEQNKARVLESCQPGVTDPFWLQGDWRALRGGCFTVGFNRCRSAYRGANAPEVRRGDRGFRIVLAPDLEAERTPDAKGNLLKEPAPGMKAEQKRTLESLNLSLLPISAGSFLMGSPGSLHSLRAALSANGQLLAHTNLARAIDVVHLPDKTLVVSTPKLPSPATAVDLSPDGKKILTGSRDGIARLWDATTGQLIQNCEGHSASIVSVAFSPDGKRFATGGLDGACRLWSSETAKTTLILRDPETRFRRLSFAPDGKRIITSGPGAKPALWSCENGQKILTLKVDPEQVTSARFSPNGSFAAVATRANRIHFCELTTGLPINFIRQNAGEIGDLAFSPDATKLLTVNMDNVVRIHRVPLGWGVIVFDQEGTATRSPDYFFTLTGSSRASANPSGLYLERWIEEQGLQAPDVSLAHSSDGKWTLTHANGALRLWRTETGSLHAMLADKLRSPVARSAFSPDGRMALAQLTTGEILVYPSVDWTSPKPEEGWTDLLHALEALDVDQARSWLNVPASKKLQ
ncbi:MAG: hypothetical protein CMI32_01320 [Opitutales bacterium]|nr:hypothetical protein [Opitutales bacterium]